MRHLLNNYSATIFVGWQDRNSVCDNQRFRKQLFIDKLGWNLRQAGDREIDEFDTGRAIYCSLYAGGGVVGGWRAMRTTEEYLARKVFPELAPTQNFPSHPDIWEISRLGVLPQLAGPMSSRLVYALMVHFALSRNVRSLVGVVDVTHARMMAIAGLKLRQHQVPQVVGHNSSGHVIKAFLAELWPAEQGGNRFDHLLKLLNNLDIRDEASLRGSESIPA